MQHWQQRAQLAERRLADLQQASPRLSEVGLESPLPGIPLEILAAINPNFDSSIEVLFILRPRRLSLST